MHNRTNYGGLDRFRIAAALLVAAIHTSPLASVSEGADFFLTRVLGRIAVPFFFMATGQFVAAGLLSPSVKTFAKYHKFLQKTSLLYLFCILLYLPVGLYAGHYQDMSPASALRMVVFDGTFYHLWYFPACILGVLLIRLMSRRLSLRAMTALSAVLYLIGLMGDSYFGLVSRVPGLNAVYEFLFRIFSYTRNGLFLAPLFLVMGMWTAPDTAALQGAAPRRPASPALLWTGFLVSFGAMTAEAFTLRRFELQRHDSMYIALVPVMFFLYRGLQLSQASSSAFLRNAAMWIYVSHPAFIIVLRGLAKPLGLTELLVDNSPVHYLAVAALSAGAGFFLAYIQERFSLKHLFTLREKKLLRTYPANQDNSAPDDSQWEPQWQDSDCPEEPCTEPETGGENFVPDKTRIWEEIPVSGKTVLSDETPAPEEILFSDKMGASEETLFPDEVPVPEELFFPNEIVIPEDMFLNSETTSERDVSVGIVPAPEGEMLTQKTNFLNIPLINKSKKSREVSDMQIHKENKSDFAHERTAPGSRAWIELDMDALEQNVNFLRSRLPGHCRLMPAVKAEAYGHGGVLLSRELNRLGVDAFCVACAMEGITLRQAGIHGEILILGYTAPEDFPLLERYRLTQTVIDYPYAQELNRFGRRLHVHIGIDTGMHRVGIRCEDIEDIASVYEMENLTVDGIFTHLCASDSPHPDHRRFTQSQIRAFNDVVDILREQGRACRGIHLLASYGILNLLQDKTRPGGQPSLPEEGRSDSEIARLAGDYVRPGIVLFGVLSTQTDFNVWKDVLRPVLSLKAKVTSVRPLYAGESVGYGITFTARQDMQIAAVSIGYADGLPRALSNGVGSVLINGSPAPIVGRICMDQTVVDITKIPGVKRGDTAVIIGSSGTREITAGQIAEQCGTITHEILTGLAPRVDRIVTVQTGR